MRRLDPTERPACAGPRQIVLRVVHPQRGEGYAVRDNGPSCFVPDGGEPIPMRVGGGGANAAGSYTLLRDPVHGDVRANELAQSDTHKVAWSRLWGQGWLVWEAVDEGAPHIRFEDDDGHVFARIPWESVQIGTPEYARKNARKTKWTKPTPEEDAWHTFTSTDGTTFAFRKGGPPPTLASVARDDVQAAWFSEEGKT